MSSDAPLMQAYLVRLWRNSTERQWHVTVKQIGTEEEWQLSSMEAQYLFLHRHAHEEPETRNEEAGAALCNEGGLLTVEGSSFFENHVTSADGRGGAIYTGGGSLTISNSSVFLCGADNGGAIAAAGAVVNLSGSTFAENEAISGGAISATDSALTLLDSELMDNLADQGGAIAGDNVEPLLIERSLFEENEALSGTGGALRLIGGSNAAIHESFFSNNKSDGRGGALYSAGGLLSVSDSTLWMNRSYNHVGGAIYATGILAVANSTLSANWGLSGAVTIEGAASDGHVLHSTLALNTSGSSGAAINVATNAQLTVQDSIVAQNSALAGNNDCATVGAGVISALGGNLDSDGSCPSFSLPNQNPQLLPLADNGGETPTHLLASTSPALDEGSLKGCTAIDFIDQRGYVRDDGACDLGAVERDAGPPVTPTVTSTATLTPTATATMPPGITPTATAMMPPGITPTATATMPPGSTPTATATVSSTSVTVSTLSATPGSSLGGALVLLFGGALVLAALPRRR